MLDLSSRLEGIAIIAALIGAGAALFGQLSSRMIGIYKDVYLDSRKSIRSARFLALQLVLILDDFCSMCFGAAMNNVPELSPSDGMGPEQDQCEIVRLAKKVMIEIDIRSQNWVQNSISPYNFRFSTGGKLREVRTNSH